MHVLIFYRVQLNSFTTSHLSDVHSTIQFCAVLNCDEMFLMKKQISRCYHHDGCRTERKKTYTRINTHMQLSKLSHIRCIFVENRDKFRHLCKSMCAVKPHKYYRIAQAMA